MTSFDSRIADAYERGTITELDALVADLEPAPEAAAIVVAAPEPAALARPSRAAPVVARSILGSVERTGSFALGEEAHASAVLASLVLDLRGAVFPAGTAVLHVRAVLASIEIIVPADVVVECEGVGILGSFEGVSRALPVMDPSVPRLRIVGKAVLGSIEVHVRPPSHVEARVATIRAQSRSPRLLEP